MSDQLWRWSATRIAKAIRQREISASDALEACLSRMADVNPKLNAVTVDLSEMARVAAVAADRAVDRYECRCDQCGALACELDCSLEEFEGRVLHRINQAG